MKNVLFYTVIAIYAYLNTASANPQEIYRPEFGPVTPAAGSSNENEFITLKAVYIDQDGQNELDICAFTVKDALNSSASASFAYFTGSNMILAGRDMFGMGCSAPVGSDTVLEVPGLAVNIDCKNTVVTPMADGKSISVSWRVAFMQSCPRNLKFYCSAFDKSGMSADSGEKAAWELLVLNGDEPPVIYPEKNLTAVIGKLSRFKLAVSDPDYPDVDPECLTYSVAGLPAGAAFDPGTRVLSWQPQARDAGTYTFILTACSSEYLIRSAFNLSAVLVEIKDVDASLASDGKANLKIEPEIYGSKVVWTDHYKGQTDPDVYMYDLDTGTKVTVAAGPNAEDGPVIYGDKIVYREKDRLTQDMSLCVYNIASRKTDKIPGLPKYMGYLSMDSDNIVWDGGGGVCRYNMGTGVVSIIVEPPLPGTYLYNERPVIYGNRVVYRRAEPGQNPASQAIFYYDVYMHDTVSKVNTALGAEPRCDENDPYVYKDKAVWTRDMYDARGIPLYGWLVLYDATTGRSEMIYNQAIDGNIIPSEPAMHEDCLVFTGDLLNVNSNIFMHKLSTSQQFAVSDTPQGQARNPSVYNNKVAWVEKGYDNFIVKTANVKLSPLINKALPDTLTPGEYVSIYGGNFGQNMGQSKVVFAGGLVAAIVNWSDSGITCKVPQGARKGYLRVITENGPSNGFMVGAALSTWPGAVLSTQGHACMSNVGEPADIKVIYTDPDGRNDLAKCAFAVNTSPAKDHGLYLVYTPSDNTISLADAEGATFKKALLGANTELSNGYATVDCKNTTLSLTPDGKGFIINWRVTFTGLFPKNANIYLSVWDNRQTGFGFKRSGRWLIVEHGPVLGSVSPEPGYSKPGQQVTISATCDDPKGKEDILLFSITIKPPVPVSSLYGDYVQVIYTADGKVRLAIPNPDIMKYEEGVLGQAGCKLSNKYCVLDCGASSIEAVPGSPTTLKMNWKITFLAAFKGEKQVFLYAQDRTGAWPQDIGVKGAWTITDNPPNNVPAAGTVSPEYLPYQAGEYVTISATYTDADGKDDIATCSMIVNMDKDPRIGLAVMYSPLFNTILYANDDGRYIHEAKLGSNNVFSNSVSVIDCLNTTVTPTPDGKGLTVNWRVAFKDIFPWETNVYTLAGDRAGASSGYVIRGACKNVKNHPPRFISLATDHSVANAGQPFTITTTFTDDAGAQDIIYCEMRINEEGSGWQNGFQATYNRQDGMLSVSDDEGVTRSCKLGTKGAMLGNSRGFLDCGATNIQPLPGSPNAFKINWKITFKDVIHGQKSVWLMACDSVNNMYMGTVGTLKISARPQPLWINPNKGESAANVFNGITTYYSDEDGAGDIEKCYIRFSDSSQAGRHFDAVYYVSDNIIRLMNDEGTGYTIEGDAGSDVVISNSYMSIDCKKTSCWRNYDPTIVTVSWRVLFKGAFPRLSIVSTAVYDKGGAFTDYAYMGTWTLKYNMTGSVRIDCEGAYTQTRRVRLMLQAQDGSGNTDGFRMKLSKDKVFWSQWQDFKPDIDFVLSSGSGIKVVYAKFKNADGYESNISGDCILSNDMPRMVMANIDGTGKDDLVIDIGQDLADGTPPGIWIIYGDGNIRNIHSLSCEGIFAGDMNNDGKDDLVIDFGPQYGLYAKYTGGAYKQLTSLTPETMVIGNFDNKGGIDVAGDFGDAYGLWIIYDDMTYAQVCPISPENMIADNFVPGGTDEIILDYGNYAPAPGTYLYMNPSSSYYLLFGGEYDTEYMIAADVKGDSCKECVIDFGPETDPGHMRGLWVGTYTGGGAGFGWEQIAKTSPEIMAAGKLDDNAKEDLMIDFGNVPDFLQPNRVWIRSDNGSYSPVTGMQVYGLSMGDMDHNGKADAVMDLGADYGIWVRQDNGMYSKKCHKSGNI